MPPSRQTKRPSRDDGFRVGVLQPVIVEDDATLVEAVRAGQFGAAARLYDRHFDAVYGLVYRLLGPDAELDDVVQEIFTDALSSIKKLREPQALRSWLMSITVGRVRSYIRWRRRKRWLTFLPNDQLPEPVQSHDETHGEVVREVCAILDRLPDVERIALVVHRVEGMSLTESAEACGTSISTFKRRLARGESKFFASAERRPALATWLEGSSHHDAR